MTPEPYVPATDNLPCFAVVGKVNMGKSAVLATLLEEDDDSIIRISPEPGETTRCQVLSLVLDNTEHLRFIDTPGFQQPIEAMRAIRRLQADQDVTPDLAVLKRFVTECREQFMDECRLLEPVLDGAGVIYIVDPDVPVYGSFKAEIEILRWTGRPRLALLNAHGDEGTGAYEEQWRELLGTAFNLVRGFDAHCARFAERRRVLAALNQIEEAHQTNLEQTCALLDAEWAQRREQAAEAMLDCLAQAFAWRQVGRYSDSDDTPEQARAQAVTQLGKLYFEHITELERQCSQQLLRLYRHKALQAQSWKSLVDALGKDIDLAAGETWRRLGLTRRQLTALGATAGAGAGLGVDAATLGHTLGLASVVGGVSGGALAFFKGDALPALSLSIGKAHIGDGRQLSLGPPRNHNFGWILLDSLLLRYQRMLAHTHGRRDRSELAAPDAAVTGQVSQLPRARRKILAHWFRRCRKGSGNHDDDGAVLTAIRDTLVEIEQSIS